MRDKCNRYPRKSPYPDFQFFLNKGKLTTKKETHMYLNSVINSYFSSIYSYLCKEKPFKSWKIIRNKIKFVKKQKQSIFFNKFKRYKCPIIGESMKDTFQLMKYQNGKSRIFSRYTGIHLGQKSNRDPGNWTYLWCYTFDWMIDDLIIHLNEFIQLNKFCLVPNKLKKSN